MIRIDAHHHLWDLTVRDQPWTADLPLLRRSFSMADLRPHLARDRIDGTVLVQTVAVAEETPELLATSADSPEVLGVVGWVDLTAGDITDRLAELRAAPGGDALVGIRHPVQYEPDPGWLTRPDVGHGLRALADGGLTYDLLVIKEQLLAAAAAVAATPELTFVLDHAGKPDIASGELDPWRRDIGELARHPNVAVKLSGLVTEASADWAVEHLRPYAEHLFTTFGAERVLFGSDWPVCTMRAPYDEVVAATADVLGGLSAAERDGVFGGNAARWYRLDKGLTADA